MDAAISLSIVVFAAIIHASFQLSVSVLTLMSGHAIGAKRSHTKLLQLTNSFLLGAGLMTLFLLSTTIFVATSIFGYHVPIIGWTVCSGILSGLGICVWLVYYRRSKGTTLWLPRRMAEFLSDRSKRTHNSSEAFGLGLTSVLSEALFLMGPIIVSGLALLHLPPHFQVIGVAIYTVISLTSLLIVGGLIGSGHTLGGIQKWRETNKKFLQFAAGSGMLILGFYIYVEEVINTAVTANPGGL